jgi:DNA polymerase III subunit delta
VILQTLHELESDLKKEGLRPIYIILGPDQYQRRLAVNLLKKKALGSDNGAFDYAEFCAGEDPIDEIIKSANTYPMLSPKRVALVSSAEDLTDSDQDALINALKNFSSRGMLILIAEELDHRKKFYRTMKDSGCIAEFANLKGIALERWAEAYVQREGHQISSAGLKKILDLAGSDLQGLSTELEKLFLFAGKQKNIPDSAIDDLVRSSRQHKIFELLDAMSARDKNGALRMLDNLLSAGESPIGIVAMMARQCRQLLSAKDCLAQKMDARDIAAKLQVLPFLLDKFMRQVRSADAESLKRTYIRLAEADRRLKSSSVDGRLLLEQVICLLV